MPRRTRCGAAPRRDGRAVGAHTVRRRTLGGTGLEVSTLGLGTMMFGSWGNPDEAACASMLHAALDAGINLVDTADLYDFGRSEQIVGAALRGRRDEVVLATKVGNPMSDDPHERGLSRRWIVRSCEASLRRLGTDRIDIYQMHRPDPATPLDETLAAFDELVAAGKVRHVGTSTFPAATLEELAALATRHGRVAPATEQPPYSILVRGAETAVFPVCRRLGLGVVAWAPLNGGWLTGKYQGVPDASSRGVREGDHIDVNDPEMSTCKRLLVDRLSAIADGAGISLVQLSLGFVLHDPVVSAALLGPRTPGQLAALLAAGHVDLGADVLAAVDAVVAPGVTVNPRDAT